MIDDTDLEDAARCQDIWHSVLTQAVNEAVDGTLIRGDRHERQRLIQAARDYVTRPNKDFNMVCYLAGVDPVAAREAIKVRLKDAKTPEELATTTGRRAGKKTGPKPRSQTPGVGLNF
ncbi:hypothetical protein K7H91_12270 [Martelella mediterranea]|uniref:hypothetical protein n=1 Tax=Martelella mediterranea TaxID=293089 RepID=UPI001E65733F|nr:hypothetical protein [Martelella mediterranea]MCD1634548.1 hypothetical protein [Martelella mediterranea]